MTHYVYDGPVRSFNNIVTKSWWGQTYATSPEKAKSNLCYRYKRQNGLFRSAKISLVNEVTEL